MKEFNFKKRHLLSGPHLFGLLLFLAGVFALTTPFYLKSGVSDEKVFIIGTITTLLGIIIMTSYEGTRIDAHLNKYMDYIIICGIRIGKWKALPPITGIKVWSKTFRNTNTPNGVSPTLSGNITEHRLLVITHPSNPPALSFTYQKKQKALKAAQALAASAGVTVESST